MTSQAYADTAFGPERSNDLSHAFTLFADSSTKAAQFLGRPGNNKFVERLCDGNFSSTGLIVPQEIIHSKVQAVPVQAQDRSLSLGKLACVQARRPHNQLRLDPVERF